ncbi:MAG: hypothetical protein ABIP55_06230 [Tepidisphaeraceae bacterium]
MLTTVAVLVIVLGLMVSLARDVRTRSADRLTTDVLRRLDTLVLQYRVRSLGPLPEAQRRTYPFVPALFDGLNPTDKMLDETRLARNAVANNKELIRTLRSQADLSQTALADLSIANYTEVHVLDAWGTPVVYMPRHHPSIGMAAGDRSFFLSAGPDRNYLTRQDNLYSYEGGDSSAPAVVPAQDR